MNLKFFAAVLGMMLIVAFSGCIGETEAKNEVSANLTENSGNNLTSETETKGPQEIISKGGDDLPLNGETTVQDVEETLSPSPEEIVPNLINETDNVEIGEMI